MRCAGTAAAHHQRSDSRSMFDSEPLNDGSSHRSAVRMGASRPTAARATAAAARSLAIRLTRPCLTSCNLDRP
jgi:hypothetical protein